MGVMDIICRLNVANHKAGEQNHQRSEELMAATAPSSNRSELTSYPWL